MNKLKELLNQALEVVKRSFKIAPFASATLAISGLLLLASLAHLAKNLLPARNDIKSASVMIVNKEVTHGGTGIILSSNKAQSSILTNDHVCRAINNGGVVVSTSGTYQITSILESELSDLCLVQVSANLEVNTKISKSSPEFYDAAVVSGHPALMPNVISTGHFSGRQIIQVMTGIRACTQEELESELGVVCAFFGGIPVVKNFESVLVTATIMPGSSGSGVYNSKNELSGVVFAGSSNFGYAWTVPYEQVVNFLQSEHTHLKAKAVSQEVSIFGQESNKTKEILQKCAQATNDEVLTYCNIIKQDMTWMK